MGNNFLFAGETLTVQGSPLHPSSKTFFDGWNDESSPLHCGAFFMLIMRNLWKWPHENLSKKNDG